jgi:hypothetical protein
VNARHRRKRRGAVPPEYQPDFPWWVYLVFGIVVAGPVLVAVILEFTG